MKDDKFIPAMASIGISWGATAIAWFAKYGSAIATLVAIIAGLYGAWAAHETVKLRKLQQKNVTKQDDE